MPQNNRVVSSMLSWGSSPPLFHRLQQTIAAFADPLSRAGNAQCMAAGSSATSLEWRDA